MFEKRTKYMRSIEFCLSLNFFIVTKRTICVTFGGFTTVCLSRAQRQHCDMRFWLACLSFALEFRDKTEFYFMALPVYSRLCYCNYFMTIY